MWTASISVLRCEPVFVDVVGCGDFLEALPRCCRILRGYKSAALG
jgi:hypothetical protein